MATLQAAGRQVQMIERDRETDTEACYLVDKATAAGKARREVGPVVTAADWIV